MTVSVFIKGRMYDYNNGRFLSVDPFIQNPSSTQSMNPYTYIFNNPLSGTDPSGYCSTSDTVASCAEGLKPGESVNITDGDQVKGTITVGENGQVAVTSGTGKTGQKFNSVALKNGNDASGVKGVSTKNSGPISDRGNQSAKMQKPVVLGEDPETGENLDQRTIKLLPVVGSLFKTAEKCTGPGCTIGDAAQGIAIAGIEAAVSKLAVGILSKVPGFRWLAPAVNDVKFLKDTDLLDGLNAADIVKINSGFSNGQTLIGKDVSTVLFNASMREGGHNQAAVLIRDIAGAHLFQNGNKRTAQTLVESLIEKNGVKGPSSTQIRSIIDKVGRGELREVDDIANELIQ